MFPILLKAYLCGRTGLPGVGDFAGEPGLLSFGVGAFLTNFTLLLPSDTALILLDGLVTLLGVGDFRSPEAGPGLAVCLGVLAFFKFLT